MINEMADAWKNISGLIYPHSVSENMKSAIKSQSGQANQISPQSASFETTKSWYTQIQHDYW